MPAPASLGDAAGPPAHRGATRRTPMAVPELADSGIALRISHVSKTFPGTRALRDVSFDLAVGGIHALVGGNGSGKSTLVKILAGVYQGDPGGRIVVRHTEVASDRMTPAKARALGLHFVHQNPAVFPDLSVAENLAIGNGFETTAIGSIRRRSLRKRTGSLLERFEIPAKPDTLVRSLRPAERSMVAIARGAPGPGGSAQRCARARRAHRLAPAWRSGPADRGPQALRRRGTDDPVRQPPPRRGDRHRHRRHRVPGRADRRDPGRRGDHRRPPHRADRREDDRPHLPRDARPGDRSPRPRDPRTSPADRSGASTSSSGGARSSASPACSGRVARSC